MTKLLPLGINTAFGSLFSNFFRLYFKSRKRRKLVCTFVESQRVTPQKRNLTGQSQKIVAANYKKSSPTAKLGNVHIIPESSFSCRHENLYGFVRTPIRYRNLAETTVLMCEQRPSPVRFSFWRKSYP